MRTFIPAILGALSLVCTGSAAWADTNADGSFSHSIPIAVPKGRAGVEPSLSLEYNSRSGNGDLGVGWSLSGLDKISRTRGPNGENPTYQWSSLNGVITQDAFLYKGQRMIRVGAGLYRLRNERYEQIQQVCTGAYILNGKMQCFWRVTTPEGWTREYGQTRDSAFIPAGSSAPHEYALSKVSDPNGNFYTVTYIYDETTGEHHPSVIKYTQHSNTTVHHEVRLNWEDRPDMDISYRGGNAPVVVNNELTNPNGFYTKYQKRLASIEVYSGSALQRRLDMTYNNEQGAACGAASGGRSRLCKVQEFGTDGVTAFPAQSFTYKGSNGTSNFFTALPAQNMQQGAGAVSWITGDFNGDGREDLGQVWNNGGPLNMIRYHSTGSGFAFATNLDMGTDLSGSLFYTAMDVNGDQKKDMVMVKKGCGTDCNRVAIRTCLATATGFAACNEQAPSALGNIEAWVSGGFRAVDVDGDGRQDIVQLTESGTTTITYVYRSNGTGFEPANSASPLTEKQYPDWFPMDVNGDGKTDLLNIHIEAGGNPDNCDAGDINLWYVLLSNGTNNYKPYYRISQNGCRAAGHTAFLTGDVNGDGLTDLVDLRANASQAETYLSNGYGFRDPTNHINQVWGGEGSEDLGRQGVVNEIRSLMDIDGDKKGDLLRVYAANGNFSVAVQKSRGIYTQADGIFDPAVEQNFPGYDAGHVTAQWMDVDGDGQSDIVQAINNAGSLNLRIYKANNPTPDLLTRIDNGRGGITEIGYESVVDHCPTPDYCAIVTAFNATNQPHSVTMAWPNVADTSPRQLAVTVRRSPDNGLNFPYETRHTFYDGRKYLSSNWERRGKNLGFRWISSRDFGGGIGGITNKTWFYQTTPIGSDPPEDNDFKIAGMKWYETSFDAAWQRWDKKEYFYSIGGAVATSYTAGASQETFARVGSIRSEIYNAGTLSGTTVEDHLYYGDNNVPADTGSIGQLKEIQFSSSKDVANTATPDTRQIFIYRSDAQASPTCPGAMISAPVLEEKILNATTSQLLSHKKTTYQASDCRPVLKQSYLIEEGRWITQGSTTYTSFGEVASMTDAGGVTSTTLYEQSLSSPFYQSAATAVSNQLGHSSSSTYDAWGQVTMQISPDGLVSLSGYDALHRPVSSYTNAVLRKSIAYPSWTEEVASVSTDKIGKMRLLSVLKDGMGREIKTSVQSDDGAAAKTVYTCTQYDSKGRVSAVSNPSYTDCGGGSGQYSRSFYDTQGRLSYQTFDDGRPRIDHIYSGPHLVNGVQATLETTRLSNQGVQRDELTYTDSKGRVIRRVVGSGADIITTNYGYDVLGRLVSVNIVGGSTLSFVYDSLGRRLSETDSGTTPAGIVTRQYWYNDSGSLARVQDAAGKNTSYLYDGIGRLIRECINSATCTASTNPAEITSYGTLGYATGKILTKTTPGSANESAVQTQYTYDAFGRVGSQSVTVDGYTKTTITTYNDTDDSVSCRINPDGSLTRNLSSAYAGLNGTHLWKIEFFDTSAQGNCNIVGVPAYSFVFNNYNAEGQAGLIDYFKGLTLANRSTKTFKNWGGLASVITTVGVSAEEVEHLTHDHNELLGLKRIVDGRSSTMFSNVETNRSRAMRYDGMGRLIQAVSGAGSTCTGGSCTTGGSAGSFNYSYAFNAAGNLSSKEGYTFDFHPQMVQRLTIGYLYGNPEIEYQYDSIGNVTSRIPCYSCYTWSYAYNHRNMLVSASYNNSVEERNTFIGETRVKKEYRPNSPSEKVQTYYFNNQYEMRVSPAGTQSHTIYVNGPNGRLAAFTRTGATYAENDIPGDNGASKTVVASIGVGHGNDGKSLAYVVFIGGVVLGMRAFSKRRRNPALPMSLRKGQWPVAGACLALLFAVLNGMGCSGAEGQRDESMALDGNPLLDTSSLIGGTATGIPASAYFMMSDHLGSPSVLTEAANQANLGKLVSIINYKPYGEVDNATSAGPNVSTQKFTGQELDEETGLYNFGARMYAAESGRFLSVDTLVDGAADGRGFLRYAYAKGNPLVYNDPTGHRVNCEDDGTCYHSGVHALKPPPKPTSPPPPKDPEPYDPRLGELADAGAASVDAAASGVSAVNTILNIDSTSGGVMGPVGVVGNAWSTIRAAQQGDRMGVAEGALNIGLDAINMYARIHPDYVISAFGKSTTFGQVAGKLALPVTVFMAGARTIDAAVQGYQHGGGARGALTMAAPQFYGGLEAIAYASITMTQAPVAATIFATEAAYGIAADALGVEGPRSLGEAAGMVTAIQMNNAINANGNIFEGTMNTISQIGACAANDWATGNNVFAKGWNAFFPPANP